MTEINILNKLWLISQQTRRLNVCNSNVRTNLEIDDAVEAYSNVADMLSILSELTENVIALEQATVILVPDEILEEDEEDDESD